jgi:hypothetical protein
MKSKGMNEAEFLALLQKVLPAATRDPHLSTAIYDHVARELRLAHSLKTFEKFCSEGSLPDLEPETVSNYQSLLETNFGKENVTVVPTEAGDAVQVEINLPEGKVTNRIRVQPEGAVEDDAAKVPWVPFPVSLPTDPELVWALARREDLGPEEAAMGLSRAEGDFWESKGGLKLQRDRVEKNFAEFIARVPAAALAERGLKRLYKIPEALKVLHRGPQPEGAEAHPAVESEQTESSPLDGPPNGTF